jgi:hypothetical protein
MLDDNTAEVDVGDEVVALLVQVLTKVAGSRPHNYYLTVEIVIEAGLEHLSKQVLGLDVPVRAQCLLLNFLAVSVVPELFLAVVRVLGRQKNLVLVGNSNDHLGLVGHLFF